MKFPNRSLISLLLVSVLMTGQAQVPVPAASPSQEQELAPKLFIWGLLLNVGLKFAMSAFFEWRHNKQTTDLVNPINYQKLLRNSSSAGLVSTLGGGVGGLMGFKSVGAEENTVADLPTKPIQLDQGQPNYQGAHVALVAFDKAGAVTGLRPMTAGFRTGDRFKLKVLPTFDALVVIENINPQGLRRQIFPSNQNEAVSVKSGIEILIPMGEQQYFEFAGVTGDEQLVITLRDPRAFGEAQATTEVSRKDEAGGSNFVQETLPGKYPVIAQSLRLNHSK